MNGEIGFCQLSDYIETYILQEGITKAMANIMTILANRLNDKVRIIEPQLKKGMEDEI